MNIFILDNDPIQAANSYCNKHVTKLPSELGNMLLWPQFYQGFTLPLTKDGNVRKLSHESHPASIWVRESRENYEWTRKHFGALCYRYQKLYKREHDAHRILSMVNCTQRFLTFSRSALTPFARCFSDFAQQLASEPDTIKAYRQFYWLDKKEFARWPSASDVPSWWPDYASEYIDKSFIDGVYTKRKSALKILTA